MTPKEEIIKEHALKMMRSVDRQDGFPLMREEIEKLFHGALDDYKQSLHVPQYDRELRLASQAVIEATSRADKAERSEKGIRNEAEGYRKDHMKLVNWLVDNGFGESCGNAASDVVKLLNLAKEKVRAQEEYSMLLNDELKETVVAAFRDGCRSTRYAEGKAIRAKIREIDKQIEEINKCPF